MFLTKFYQSSFFPCMVARWDFLTNECFPPDYDVTAFKGRDPVAEVSCNPLRSVAATLYCTGNLSTAADVCLLKLNYHAISNSHSPKKNDMEALIIHVLCSSKLSPIIFTTQYHCYQK